MGSSTQRAYALVQIPLQNINTMNVGIFVLFCSLLYTQSLCLVGPNKYLTKNWNFSSLNRYQMLRASPGVSILVMLVFKDTAQVFSNGSEKGVKSAGSRWKSLGLRT